MSGARVGVDVGGSGLRLIVRRDGVDDQAHAAAGARVGPEGLDVAALVSDARRLVDIAGVARPEVVVWGSRGLSLTDPAQVLAAVAEGLGGERTVVVIDAVTALVGAVGSVTPAACVAAGTGAIAVGADFAGGWRRVDGWGHIVGDRGSAAWMGMSALRVAARAFDEDPRRRQPLLEAAVRLYGEVPTWPRQVMGRPDAVETLARFAPRVSALAAQGDPDAMAICGEGGRALAESVLAAARLGDGGGTDLELACTGEVLRAGPVRDAFDARLAEDGRRAHDAVGTPVQGALLLAEHLACGGSLVPDPSFLLVAG